MSAIGTSDIDLDDYYDKGAAVIDKVEHKFSAIEFLEYIPLVSSIVGIVRILFGIIEVLVGLVALPFQLGARAMSHKSPLIIVQGFSDIIRGKVAIVPFLGNIILYIYDHSNVVKHDVRQACGLQM